MGTTGGLQDHMHRLGRTYWIAMFVGFSVGGRSLIFTPCAFVAVRALLGILDHVPHAEARRHLGSAIAAVGAAAGLGIANLTPGLEPGGPAALALIAAISGTALYATAMRRWCSDAGWNRLARTWRRTANGMWTFVGLSIAAITALIAFGEHAAYRPSDRWGEVAFGRTLDGWPAGASAVVLFGVLATASWWAATAHRSMYAALERYGLPGEWRPTAPAADAPAGSDAGNPLTV